MGKTKKKLNRYIDETFNFAGISPNIGCKPGGWGPGCNNCCVLITAKQRSGISNLSSLRFKKATVPGHRKWSGKIVRQPNPWQKWTLNGEGRAFIFGYIGDCCFYSVSDFEEALHRASLSPQHLLVILTSNPRPVIKKLGKAIENTGLAPDNVRLGVSVEGNDQLWRINEIRNFPFFKKEVWFLPLLEEIKRPNLRKIHIIRVGGELGANCRPFKQVWAKKLQRTAKTVGCKCIISKRYGRKGNPNIHSSQVKVRRYNRK